MNTHADDDIKRALDALEQTPEHLPDYRDSLLTRLGEEAVAAHAAHDRVAAARRRRRRPFALAAAAVLAGLAGLVLVLVGLPGGGERTVVVPGVDEATAAGRMASRMAWAMANAESLHGRFTQEEEGIATVTGEFWITDRGDYRVEALLEPGPEFPSPLEGHVETVFVYNAEERALQTWDSEYDRLSTVVGVWGPVAPYPLHVNPLTDVFDTPDFAKYEAYAAAVRGLVAGEYEGISVDETTYDGRPAWRAELPIFAIGPDVEYGERSAEEAETRAVIAGLTVTVDKETGLMVRLERRWLLLGEPTPWDWGPFVLELSDLEIDEEMPGSLFELREDEDVRKGYSVFDEPAQVAEQAGYDLLVPSRLPDGFDLTDSSWTRFWPHPAAYEAWVSWGSIRMGGATPMDSSAEDAPGEATEVTLQYRRGLDWVLIRQIPTGRVTLSARTDDPEAEDPEALLQQLADPAFRWGYEQREVVGGALAGRTAYTWLTSFGGSLQLLQGPGVFVWGETEDDISYLIMGTLTREELVDIANSMESLSD